MSGGPQNGTVSLGNNMYGPQGSPYGQAYGSQPMFSGYRNSGAGRFTTIPSWQPNAYVPQVYRPNLFTIPNGGVRPPPGGLLNPGNPTDPGGMGGAADGAGNSSEGMGGAPSNVGNATNDPSASIAAMNAMGLIGLGIPGIGTAVSAADGGVSAAAAAAGGGEGSNPGGVAAAEGTSSGATGEGSGGGPAGDGGGGGSGK